MPRIALISPLRADAELRAAYDYANRRWSLTGVPPVALMIARCFCHRPRLLRGMADGYYYFGWCGRLPRAVRESVAVMVSRENDCFY